MNKPGWGPVTFGPTEKYHSTEYNVYSCSSHGPTFGYRYADIYIASEASSNTYSYSHLGYTYKAPSGYSYGSTFANSFLAGNHTFQPDEIEVFYETNYK